MHTSKPFVVRMKMTVKKKLMLTTQLAIFTQKQIPGVVSSMSHLIQIAKLLVNMLLWSPIHSAPEP